MPKIDVKELFKRLCSFEYDLIKYINRTQGDESAPIKFAEAAIALCTDKKNIRNAITRLVNSEVLIADGENIKINWEVFKAPEEAVAPKESAKKD